MKKNRLPQPLTCRRCGYCWRPRKPETRICPKCKSAKWDVPKGEEVEKEVS